MVIEKEIFLHDICGEYVRCIWTLDIHYVHTY